MSPRLLDYHIIKFNTSVRLCDNCVSLPRPYEYGKYCFECAVNVLHIVMVWVVIKFLVPRGSLCWRAIDIPAVGASYGGISVGLHCCIAC